MSTIVLTLNPHDRLTLATTIERLINLLDEIDGDADLEAEAPDCDLAGATTDREYETDDYEAEPVEPNHGWHETCGQGADAVHVMHGNAAFTGPLLAIFRGEGDVPMLSASDFQRMA